MSLVRSVFIVLYEQGLFYLASGNQFFPDERVSGKMTSFYIMPSGFDVISFYEISMTEEQESLE